MQGGIVLNNANDPLFQHLTQPVQYNTDGSATLNLHGRILTVQLNRGDGTAARFDGNDSNKDREIIRDMLKMLEGKGLLTQRGLVSGDVNGTKIDLSGVHCKQQNFDHTEALAGRRQTTQEYQHFRNLIEPPANVVPAAAPIVAQPAVAPQLPLPANPPIPAPPPAAPPPPPAPQDNATRQLLRTLQTAQQQQALQTGRQLDVIERQLDLLNNQNRALQDQLHHANRDRHDAEGEALRQANERAGFAEDLVRNPPPNDAVNQQLALLQQLMEELRQMREQQQQQQVAQPPPQPQAPIAPPVVQNDQQQQTLREAIEAMRVMNQALIDQQTAQTDAFRQAADERVAVAERGLQAVETGLREQIALLRAQAAEASARDQNNQRVLLNQAGQIGELNEERRHLEQQLHDLELELRYLERQARENNHLADRLRDLQTHVDDGFNRICRLLEESAMRTRADEDRLRLLASQAKQPNTPNNSKEIDDLQKQLEDSEVERRRLLEEKRQLEEQLRELEELRRQLAELQQNNTQSAAQIRQENQRLRTENTRMAARIKELEDGGGAAARHVFANLQRYVTNPKNAKKTFNANHRTLTNENGNIKVNKAFIKRLSQDVFGADLAHAHALDDVQRSEGQFEQEARELRERVKELEAQLKQLPQTQ